MARTENLRAYIVNELKKVCPNVCYTDATDSTPYPYIIYDLNYVKDEHRFNYQLEINIWDKNISPKVVEELADDIENGMDYTCYTDENQSLDLYVNTRNNVEDPDKSLKRVRILLDVNYYGN